MVTLPAQRRDAIVAAVIEIVADRGLDAVSVREVATAAKVSIGAVQHHFPTKSAMLLAAMESVEKQTETWLVDQRLTGTPMEVLGRLLRALLPHDEPGGVSTKVWIAFIAKAAVDDELAGVHATGAGYLRGYLTQLAGAAREAGELTTELPPEVVGRLLLSVLDGLCVAGVSERADPEELERALTAALSLLTR